AAAAPGQGWAWGDNNTGQLGIGTFTDSNVPIQVTGQTDVVSIAGGGGHSLAVRLDGTTWAWGANDFGQLGNGTTTISTVPVQVSGLTDAVAVAAGGVPHPALPADPALMASGPHLSWP